MTPNTIGTLQSVELAKSNADTGKSAAKHGLIGGAIGTGTGALLGLIAGNTVRGLATGLSLAAQPEELKEVTGARKNMKVYLETV